MSIVYHGSTRDCPTPKLNGSCPGHIRPVLSVLDLIKERHSAAFKMWDGWAYKIHSPMSLDDPPMMQVIFENKSGALTTVQLPLEGV